MGNAVQITSIWAAGRVSLTRDMFPPSIDRLTVETR